MRGFGTSVTPVSQFYFQQAFANVVEGPWKKITDGYGQMVLGYFGKTPVPPDPEIVKIASKQLGKPVFTGDPLSIIDPGIPKAKKLLEENGLPITDENIFIVGALATKGGNKGLDFLKGDKPINVRKVTKNEAPTGTTPAAAQGEASGYTVVVNGVSYQVDVQENSGTVTSIKPNAVASAPKAAQPTPVAKAVIPKGKPVLSPLPGNILNVLVKVGQQVEKGDVLLIVEAMKMENPVVAPFAGKINSIEVKKGGTVKAEEVVLTIDE
jgi:pyruvate carboxylase subunit B